MTTQKPDLNLARKWRPQNFDQIVGQDVAIRMLKNSLYLKKFFPVYLFAGQRGCGKTTTARVFAAAINCKLLQNFQENPTQQAIPCLTCDSCKSMVNGQHPDFIEVDAASHTGVDNVRQIIDSSSYMPLSGQKKIYLIDEVHMLSKAAFNAFLKILEEPPVSVLFILATTEIPKIPATILSRCFQVIFNPIEHQSLKDHIRSICVQENVTINDAAIDLLLEETEGSARDAINLLERVRFSGDNITEQTVLQVLGKLSNKELLELFDILIDQNGQKLLAKLQLMSFETLSPQMVWDMVVNLCRSLLWVKYGVENIPGSFNKDIVELKRLAHACSLNRLNAIFQLLWSQEELFLRTSKKHLFLEMVLLQICEQVNLHDLEDILKNFGPSSGVLSGSNSKISQTSRPTYTNSSGSSGPGQQTSQTVSRPVQSQSTQNYSGQSPQAHSQQAQQANNPINNTQTTEQQTHVKIPKSNNQDWDNFLTNITGLSDPFLTSILMQAQFVHADVTTKLVTIQVVNNGPFLRDKIEEARSIWLPVLLKSFPDFRGFDLQQGSIVNSPVKIITQGPALAERPSPSQSQGQSHYGQGGGSGGFVRKNYAQAGGKSFQAQPKQPAGEYINVQDSEKWPVANLIVNNFPGKIKKISDNLE